MKSKTKINYVMQQKTNPFLAETLLLAKKGNQELASLLAVPSRQRREVNLDQLNDAKTSEVIVPGKVLGSGNITKKLTVYAVAFSEQAKEKLKKAGCSAVLLLDALKKNLKLKAEIIK
jgi:large subunit ribosomal protein L18e